MRLLVIVLALAAAGTAAAGKKQAALSGTWSSPSCGPRTYERRITFTGDGTFKSEDRISPCPEGVACVWSGIVAREGTFKLTGATIKLTPSSPGAAQGTPLPATLSWKRGALAEKSGDAVCPYTRK